MNAKHRFDNTKRRRPDGHPQQAWLTPAYVLEPIRQLLGGIGLDPCTDPDNPTNAGRWYALPEDGCMLPWDSPTVFVNPPYGEARNRWIDRAIAEGSCRKIVLLIPAHTDTRGTQRALEACTSALFVRSRLKFGALRENRRQQAASHGSVLFGFGVDLTPICHLGAVLTPHTRATP